MDTAATLDQYAQDVSNLPAELLHILTELGTKDAIMYEAKKKLNAKDAIIHKFIRQNGSMTKFPKEGQLYPKIREEFEILEQQQKEKMVLANTSLFLTTKHLMRLQADIEKLQNEGLLVREDNQEFDLTTDVFATTSSSRLGSVGPPTINSMGGLDPPFINPGSINDVVKKHNKKSSTVKVNSHAPSASRSLKRQKTDELNTPEPEVPLKKTAGASRERTPQTIEQEEANKEDDEVYCFCGGPSYGSMVGCDGDSCQHEWFHFTCVGITEQPVGSWYCDDCKRKNAEKEKKQKKKKRS